MRERSKLEREEHTCAVVSDGDRINDLRRLGEGSVEKTAHRDSNHSNCVWVEIIGRARSGGARRWRWVGRSWRVFRRSHSAEVEEQSGGVESRSGIGRVSEFFSKGVWSPDASGC